MGYQAGEQTPLTLIGFLLAGVGLPFLGVIAMAVSGSESVYQMASQISGRFARWFTLLLYLVIGPLFALPRLATTSFEIGVAPSLTDSQYALFLTIFSCAFFGVAYLFASRPTRLLGYIGKVLNPLFLLALFSLLTLIFIQPLDYFLNGSALPPYDQKTFFAGFLDGYNTLDTLAALAFGVVISDSIQSLGVRDKGMIARTILIAGSGGMMGMVVVYSLLAFAGAMTSEVIAGAQNGGQILAQLSAHYLDRWGNILLAIILIIACLKTAIGLISSFAQTFEKLYPQKSYRFWSIWASILPMLIANFGLTAIIDSAGPILMFIYPLAIVLIVLTLFKQRFPINQGTCRLAIIFTSLASFHSALLALPATWQQFPIITNFVDLGNFLPLSSLGLGWLLPALLGILIGLIRQYVQKS